eukprot:SAG31_NODE_6829_length_1875_cov_4.819820_2_plen_321_part_00
MTVGDEPIRVYTKTGRLVRQKVERTGCGTAVGFRPATSAGATTAWPTKGIVLYCILYCMGWFISIISLLVSLPTKGAGRFITDDFSANGAFLSHAESRERLGPGLPIHTLRIHDADTVGGPGATQATGALDQALLPQGMLAGLAALKADGAIHNISLGMNAHRGHRTVVGGDASWTPAVIIDFIEAAPEGLFDSALLAYGWNLLNQDAYEVMAVCAQNGISVHLAGIFGGGQYPLFNRDGPNFDVDKVAKWEKLANKHSVSLAAVAISFGALPTCVEKVVMGLRSVAELKMNLEAMTEVVPEALWVEAQSLGLLRKDLPF